MCILIFPSLPGPEHSPVLCAAGALAARLLGPDQHHADHQALVADLGPVLSLDGRWLPRVRGLRLEEL